MLAVTGVAVWWPGRVRAWLLVRAYQAVPLVLPLTIAIVSSLPPRPAGPRPAQMNEDDRRASSASANPGYL